MRTPGRLMEHKVWAYSRRSFGTKAAYPAGWTQARVDEIWANLNIVIVGGGGRRQSPSDARNVETGGALPPPEAIDIDSAFGKYKL